ncbi:hypothetical protein AWENTII_006435 [Aspergillus wentii]|nr:hypothetical protein MW887_003223 [Aspergillus wentii]
MRLPWELVQQILECAVEILPLSDLFQTRLICTTFSDEIFTLLLSTPRLDDEAWSCTRLGRDEAVRRWTTFPDRLKRQYLYHKIQQHTYSPCVYSEFVHEALDSQGQLSPNKREEFISQMIDATWWSHYQFNLVFCTDKRDQWKKWYETHLYTYYMARRLPPIAADVRVALLCSAIRRNDTVTAQKLLNEKVGMDEFCYRFGAMPIDFAAKWGGREIIAMLIKKGKPIEYDMGDWHSKCAFTLAARNRNFDALESYIEHCKPPGTYCSVSTAMIKAAKTMARIGDIEMLDFLGERYNRDTSILRYEALIAAIKSGQLSTIQHIFNLGEFDLDMRTESSFKGLLFSAIYDSEPDPRFAVVKLLLENGVDPNQSFPGVGVTALQRTLRECHSSPSGKQGVGTAGDSGCKTGTTVDSVDGGEGGIYSIHMEEEAMCGEDWRPDTSRAFA